MFVAFELQIGLKGEIEMLRETHVSYEEGRILNSQPLLKAYKDAHENLNEVDASTTSTPSSLTKKAKDHDDFKIITALSLKEISPFPPIHFLSNQIHNICNYCVLGQKEMEGEGTASIVPKRLCLNNKR